MTTKNRGPKKGAAQKWSQRLKELGEQPPPKELLEKIQKKDKERAAHAPMINQSMDV